MLPPRFYEKMLAIEPEIPKRYAFFNNPTLSNMENRRAHWDGETKQVISFVNALPEDYVGPAEAAALCWEGNEELIAMRRADTDMFEAAVLMVPMNNMDEAVRIVREQVASNDDVVGVQVFTRALGQSIADEQFRPLFAALAEANALTLLHPVFDPRKPDNNIVFSWEYELTQAMLQMVQAGLLRDFPNLKVICHHAGAMVPFFAGRVDRIMPPAQAADMRMSVATEPGVLYLYACSFADDPLHWVFWEGYASEEAYEAHRATEHFQTYIAGTADCLSEKELVQLAADCLVSKGVLNG